MSASGVGSCDDLEGHRGGEAHQVSHTRLIVSLPGEGEEIPNVFAFEHRLFLSIMPLEEAGGSRDDSLFVRGPTAKSVAVRQVIFFW